MAVTRKLPNTDAGRALAMDLAALKISLTPPADVVFSLQAQAQLATVRAAFNLNLGLRGAALSSQAELTPGKDAARKLAGFWISHFVEAHDKAAKRGETGFVLANRSFFQLDATNEQNPPLGNDQDVFLWGERVITGNVARLAAGKPVIPFPTIANVTAKYDLFATAFGTYNEAKDAYDAAQEAISSMRTEVDGLILRLWNEAEAFYSVQDAASRRRHCRSWGVAYVLVAGTEPTADDFSIIGTVTDIVSGNAIADVSVEVVETGTIVLTDNQGKYFIPVLDAGNYTIKTHKGGYTDKTVDNVAVTAGAITTTNIALTEAPVLISVVLEGSPAMGTIDSLITSGFIFTESTTVQVEVSLNPLEISASPAPGPIMGDTVWHNNIGIQNKTGDGFSALVGASETNIYLKVQCLGPLTGHYKITFNNVVAV